MFVTFTLLTAAILALWLPVTSPAAAPLRLTWIAFFSAAVTAGLMTGIVRPLGVLWLALLAGAIAVYAKAPVRSAARVLACLAILLTTAGLFMHLLPGFANPLAIPLRRITPDALPYRLHLNFDKASAGLLLIALLHVRATALAEWRTLLRYALPVIVATVVTLLGLSLLCGYVRFDSKFPPEAPLFLWANLCLTCLAEEALFRGFIQAQLAQRWRNVKRGPHLALVVAAMLFGLAHFAGGPTYVVLSALAGLGYGAAYLCSGNRIEASILTHFAVNTLHFVGFTYPALQRG